MAGGVNAEQKPVEYPDCYLHVLECRSGQTWILPIRGNSLLVDGRDNEEMKLRAYEAALGPLTVEILPQAK